MTDWSGTPRRLGWLLTLGWIATLAFGALTGSHPSTLGELKGEIRAGQVSEVFVTGGLEPGWTGSSTVELRWHSNGFDHHAEVVETTPGTADRLARTGPGVHVLQGEPRSSHGLLLDWQVPVWVAVGAICLWLLTLGLILRGPVPHRATRAAWVWLVVLAAPVGVPAYLVLGGPTGIRRAPRLDAQGRRRRGLTGGWAFVLGLVLAGAANSG